MLRVRLLGELTLEADARAVALPAAPAARALLVWLALHPGTQAPAELAAGLWPELAGEERTEALDAALDDLAVALGEEADTWRAVTASEMALVPDAELWVDALMSALEALAARAERTGDLEAAARWTQTQAALDPLSEERHRALIARLAAVGDRAGAMAAYEGLRARLRSDLRIKPSAETQALVERLGRAGDPAG
ncbi:MAG: hypothetical protein QOG15_3485 [Solirubrobacteraceae bacterium]|jgi:DNA-binding SARP family transcriptional activator|nr:hypothetical protein [Solirubrobacteraceae bacterium]